MRITFK